MRKCAVALSLVLALAGIAYGMRDRREIRYFPRDRVVEREVIVEKPVYREEKPSKHKWWKKWRKSERKEEREHERDR